MIGYVVRSPPRWCYDRLRGQGATEEVAAMIANVACPNGVARPAATTKGPIHQLRPGLSGLQTATP